MLFFILTLALLFFYLRIQINMYDIDTNKVNELNKLIEEYNVNLNKLMKEYNNRSRIDFHHKIEPKVAYK
jgi:uncharacterized protein YsxB (DUF464 family)